MKTSSPRVVDGSIDMPARSAARSPQRSCRVRVLDRRPQVHSGPLAHRSARACAGCASGRRRRAVRTRVGVERDGDAASTSRRPRDARRSRSHTRRSRCLGRPPVLPRDAVMSATRGHMTIATLTATETYCRCGNATALQFCPTCGSADRFTFTAAQVQERRPPRWMYLVAGLVLQAVAIGATVWMLS